MKKGDLGGKFLPEAGAVIEESPSTSLWLGRFLRGDAAALAELFDHYRPRLRHLVEHRLDRRVAARVAPSEVLQEVYLDVSRQIHDYLEQPKVCFFVWLRGLTWQRLVKLHRRHSGAQRRAVGRELPVGDEASSVLAAKLVAAGSSPSQALLREELCQRVQKALAKLAPEDREVILMRDFEGMSNTEVAQALDLSASGATMRYGRALIRLKEALEADWPAGESKP